MHIPSARMLSFAFLLAIAFGCHRATPPPSPPSLPISALAGDWTLIGLDAQQALPPGADGRHATLRFEVDPARVEGFAGCNRLSASYTLAGDSLHFVAAALTQMACPEGMELEGRLSEALSATNRFQVTGGELTLFGASGPVARFARGTP